MQITFIRHNNTPCSVLKEICLLKSVRWNYSTNECLNWTKENIWPDDYHLILSENGIMKAYCNLAEINMIVNGTEKRTFGIGNVCTRESGKGYGDLLMKEVNRALVENNWRGILLCKDGLVPYYEKYGWKSVNPKIISSELLSTSNTMVYNFETEINQLKYEGRNF